MKTNLILVLCLFIFASCQNSQKKNKLNENKSGQQTETETDINFSPIKSFAVVWDWTEGNSIEDVIPIIQKQVAEVNDLWKKGIIENAYINTKSQLNDTETFSNAFFIINGKSEKEVRTILNKTPAFTSGITKYKLYPVGVKWLKRNSKAMQKAQESKNSFAVVWTPIEYDEKYEQMVEEQGMKIIELWNEGIIENVYLDVEKIGKKDLQSPALVFFINASTKEDAAKLLDELPFVKMNIGTYSLYSVGTFWMSTPEDYY
ncbi:MAG: hypothetical protein P8M02_02535 [Flavobacteriaceae bacterium]|nr:hypothetical protein [Flavobacteriaceae bacterium]MDG2386276.1 hypothetical protein [Flavobacteriaceae bacterium]